MYLLYAFFGKLGQAVDLDKVVKSSVAIGDDPGFHAFGERCQGCSFDNTVKSATVSTRCDNPDIFHGSSKNG